MAGPHARGVLELRIEPDYLEMEESEEDREKL